MCTYEYFYIDTSIDILYYVAIYIYSKLNAYINISNTNPSPQRLLWLPSFVY